MTRVFQRSPREGSPSSAAPGPEGAAPSAAQPTSARKGTGNEQHLARARDEEERCGRPPSRGSGRCPTSTAPAARACRALRRERRSSPTRSKAKSAEEAQVERLRGHHCSSTSSEQKPGPMAMSRPRSPGSRLAGGEERLEHEEDRRRREVARLAQRFPGALQRAWRQLERLSNACSTFGPPVWAIQWRMSLASRPCSARKASTSAADMAADHLRHLGAEHDFEARVDHVPAHHPLGVRVEDAERVARTRGAPASGRSAARAPPPPRRRRRGPRR